MVRFQDLAALAIVFVIAGISLGIGAEVLSDVKSDLTTGTIAERAVGNATLGIEELASWTPTIALVIAAAIVIGVIFSAFRGGG